MTNEEFRNLRPGDVVRPLASRQAYIVTAGYRGNQVTAALIRFQNIPLEFDFDLSAAEIAAPVEQPAENPCVIYLTSAADWQLVTKAAASC